MTKLKHTFCIKKKVIANSIKIDTNKKQESTAFRQIKKY